VLQQKQVGADGQHRKLVLLHRDASGGEARRDAILFGCGEPLPERIRAVYTPSINEWNGRVSVQFTLAYWKPEPTLQG
jgi:single-stranded-DNA-specific exonuclease